MMHNKSTFKIALIFLCFAPILVHGQTSPTQTLNANVVLQPNVKDTRILGGLRTRSANGPGQITNVSTLKVGDVFINESNIARVVTNIYKRNGKTFIETAAPPPEDVIADLFVPDFDIQLDQSHFASLGEGVSFANPLSGSQAPRDLLALGGADPRIQSTSSGIPRMGQTRWMETDPLVQVDNTLSLRIDKVLYKGTTSPDSDSLLASIKKGGADIAKADADQNKPTDPNAPPAEEGGGDSGKPSIDFGAKGEIRISGVLRLMDPRLRGGLTMPSIKISWVKVWFISIPYPSFTKGYVWTEITTAQQFDFVLKGTLNLSTEVKIPMGTLMLVEPNTQLFVKVELYGKVGIEGTISLGAEVSEYTYLQVGMSADLVWPFIPVKASARQDFYMNAAFRPMLAAQAEARAGLYLYGGVGILGVDVAGMEGGGGLYINANGYLEPLGVMGFDTSRGGYGNFSDWILYIQAEAGAFAIINAKIFSWTHELFLKKWPFWTYANQWEF